MTASEMQENLINMAVNCVANGVERADLVASKLDVDIRIACVLLSIARERGLLKLMKLGVYRATGKAC